MLRSFTVPSVLSEADEESGCVLASVSEGSVSLRIMSDDGGGGDGLEAVGPDAGQVTAGAAKARITFDDDVPHQQQHRRYMQKFGYARSRSVVHPPKRFGRFSQRFRRQHSTDSKSRGRVNHGFSTEVGTCVFETEFSELNRRDFIKNHKSRFTEFTVADLDYRV